MGEPYTLPAVSGPKESIPTLLDTSLLGRFQDLDQVRVFCFFTLSFGCALDFFETRLELALPPCLFLLRQNAFLGEDYKDLRCPRAGEG